MGAITGRRGRDPAPERLSVERFPCSRCGAQPGQPCTPKQGSRLGHANRVAAHDAALITAARGGLRTSG